MFQRRLESNVVECLFCSDSEQCHNCESAFVNEDTDPIDSTIHSLFGHGSDKRIKRALELDDNRTLWYKKYRGHGHNRWCNACSLGGSTRPKVQHKCRHAKRKECTKFGERISSDLCDIEEESIGRHRYAICFFDNATRWLEVYFLRSKSSDEVLNALIRFQHEYADRLKWNDGNVLEWHTDCGGEFESNSLDKFCKQLCILNILDQYRTDLKKMHSLKGSGACYSSPCGYYYHDLVFLIDSGPSAWSMSRICTTTCQQKDSKILFHRCLRFRSRVQLNSLVVNTWAFYLISSFGKSTVK